MRHKEHDKELVHLTWAGYGKLLDWIEVLECREVQYQKFIRYGVILNNAHRELLHRVAKALADSYTDGELGGVY